MLVRSTDSAFLNSVVNHPEVYPWVTLGTKGKLDVTDAVSNPDNVFLANEFGGFLFVKDKDKYECHSQFIPEGRGRMAYLAAKEAARYMFTKTDCLAIRTYVPEGNVAADALARKVGFTKWADVELNDIPASLYMLTIKMWARTLGECQCQ